LAALSVPAIVPAGLSVDGWAGFGRPSAWLS
jgi:hypothetical protein